MAPCDVILIDDDLSRRAQIFALLECIGVSARRFDDVDDFANSGCRGLVILIAGRQLSDLSVLASLAEGPNPQLIIPFGPEPCLQEVVAAMRNGAADYLRWPFSACALRQRIEAVRAIATNPSRGQGDQRRRGWRWRSGLRGLAKTLAALGLGLGNGDYRDRTRHIAL